MAAQRSLHTWGIALGLMVTGQRGERTVTVQPGYALDCLGRDLLVSATLAMPVPPVSGDEAAPGAQNGAAPPKTVLPDGVLRGGLRHPTERGPPRCLRGRRRGAPA